MISASKLEWTDGYGDVKTVAVERDYRRLTFRCTLNDDDDKIVKFEMGYNDIRAILEMFKDPDQK